MRTHEINFGDLRYLSVAANAGNFSRAAKYLGVRTSTVSRRIALLENELGLTLFERGHFGIRLTNGGRTVMIHVQRLLGELEAVKTSAHSNASGNIGTIRLGIRVPLIGGPLQSILEAWRAKYPNVNLALHELNDRDILAGIEERRLDVAIIPRHTVWPHAVAEPIYHEQILIALSKTHHLSRRRIFKWDVLHHETFLVQGWDESQAARDLYSTFLGRGVRYQSHSASKQSVLALVGAGFGVTLVTRSQASVRFPNVIFKTIAEKNAKLELDLVWVPENEEAVVGRFVAFMRDEVRSRRLV